MFSFFRASKSSSTELWQFRKKIEIANNKVIKRYYKWRYNRMQDRAGANIPLSAQFAEKPEFPHSIYGVFISQGAVIGSGCTIFHQVTIGSNTLNDTKREGAPRIGNNVYIGCGAKIIGGIKIGNNVRIGANCVITEDIPDNCTVVMEKPRIIVHEIGRNNTFSKFGTDNSEILWGK